MANLYAGGLPVLVSSQLMKRAASYQLTPVAGRFTPLPPYGVMSVSVIPKLPNVLALVIMTRLTSNFPMLYVYGTEPAGLGSPVVLAPLPNVSPRAREVTAEKSTARSVREVFIRVPSSIILAVRLDFTIS